LGVTGAAFEVGRDDEEEVGSGEVRETGGFDAPDDWLARAAARLGFDPGARRLPTARGTNAGPLISADEVDGGGSSSGAGEAVVAAEGVAGPENSESGVSMASEAGVRGGRGSGRRSKGQVTLGLLAYRLSVRVVRETKTTMTTAIYSCERRKRGERASMESGDLDARVSTRGDF
jgi:hypothetical protein